MGYQIGKHLERSGTETVTNTNPKIPNDMKTSKQRMPWLCEITYKYDCSNSRMGRTEEEKETNTSNPWRKRETSAVA